jgi:putative endonuclease
MLASGVNGTLYIGVTSALYDRVATHREDLVEGFTSRHQVHRLVWYELHAAMTEAIRREKQLKKWSRLWKIRLIEQMNPQWEDLFDEAGGIREGGTGGQGELER